ncbi:MAG: alternative ribosome rescue aminoacyl-tRNA hydrolase ArfB, partial [Actinomycetota bacterium]
MGDEGVLRVRGDCVIPLAELDWRFTTSSGPGGQHANRSATRAEVTFDVASSATLTERQRARITQALGPVVVVRADDHRSQTRNRQLAQDRLRGKLAEALHEDKPRRRTKPSRNARRKRVESKRRRGET